MADLLYPKKHTSWGGVYIDVAMATDSVPDLYHAGMIIPASVVNKTLSASLINKFNKGT